jgi:predicted O-methyltransferase YrrM
MSIVDPNVDRYLHDLTPARDPIVAEMERLAGQRRFPIVGPLVGRFLYQQARAIGARTVFECGSGFGYSAWWFARAVGAGGKVTLTEGSPENCDRARDYLGRAGLLDRVHIRQGDGLEILASTSGPLDLIFCDVDKHQYPRVHPLLASRLRPGGLFICDNMLWFGRVAGPDRDPDTEGVRELTRLLYSDPGLQTTILPLRDGLSVSLRI